MPEFGQTLRPLDDSGESVAEADATGARSIAQIAAALPIAGLSRRRLALAAAVLAGIWVVAVLSRQVGDSSAITLRADTLRDANAALAGEVAALDDELAFIQRPEFVALQARSYRVGSEREIPFSLGAAAPALAPDAPGSASVALGAENEHTSPLESWLTVLFGPAD